MRDGIGPDCPILESIWQPNRSPMPIFRELSNEAKEIEFLIMPGTHITDDALVYLQEMPRLKELTLGRTCVTRCRLQVPGADHDPRRPLAF